MSPRFFSINADVGCCASLSRGMKTPPKPSKSERPTPPNRPFATAIRERFLGIDIGAETIKALELVQDATGLHPARRRLLEHGKRPGPVLLDLLREWDWDSVQSAAVTGRLSRQVNLLRVPAKQAQARGYRFLFDHEPATIVSIGSHGFSVLELRANGTEIFRENNRCSQGTGNFLRQLVERFSLTIEEASALCAGVEQSAPLSGRCPVILKTDMTHLANKGENRAQILAGLFDAVCENVLVLIKPGISPPQVRLIGGVSRSARIRNVFQQTLASRDMALLPMPEEDALFLEALGTAVVASRHPEGLPTLDKLLSTPTKSHFARLPALSHSLKLVRRMARPPLAPLNGEPQPLIIGFDIGSTGSKAVAISTTSPEIIWEAYLRTAGDPVRAAQALTEQFLAGPAGRWPVQSLGVTGSGREIVGSLMATCYGKDAVFILNEIAAHAEGALHYDPRVDTIFEIGGQDAKYIRLAEGRVIDCAMNEACSAGTGSFIEEQGRKFAGIRDVVHLGQEALAAPHGVSLGQHCSVFMAEIIDESVAAGVEQRSIIAGLYDSIIRNYLNRVKGNRSVGQVIFCQGMPFASDALAAAVARQTGSQVILPPNPGTVGAFGIALLARRERVDSQSHPIDLTLFLGARVEKKDTFICKSKTGCGGSGNHCRIDSLKTVVSGQPLRFTWGGGCALHDHGTRKKKLPDLAPDPFRERDSLVRELLNSSVKGLGLGRIALADEFMLKGLFPFFASFFHELGYDLLVPPNPDQTALKRGIQESNVPFCAPMQLFHGLLSQLVDGPADFFFVPMVRSLTRSSDEPRAVNCPIVQAGPDLLGWDLQARTAGRILSPVINIGPGNLESAAFLASCRRLVTALGLTGQEWLRAFHQAREVQHRIDRRCAEIGRQALDYCAARGITAVVVVGRPYTIYNDVLNSHVPGILREQGAVAIPIDCYPVDGSIPAFHAMYWAHGQRILRAACQIRRSPGVYSVYCSNYSCGPDSFNLHFYGYIMDGKPFAVIETDGHSGDAGTKTRIEAFLHCVQQDLHSTPADKPLRDFRQIELPEANLAGVSRSGERMLVPNMGPCSQAVAAALRGIGIPAECLAQPDETALNLGRRFTSGKECLPMCLTLGNLLKRIEPEKNNSERFVLMMPGAGGPCRFGAYNLLNRITLERLGWNGRLRIWEPRDSGYFDGTPPGWAILLFTGFMAEDLLLEALLDARPVETRRGAANRIYQHYQAELHAILEKRNETVFSMPASLWQVASGQLFGLSSLLAQAAADFASVRGDSALPTVMLVGEIYVRCDPFANDHIAEKLEARGLRVRLAPCSEWLEYCDGCNRRDGKSRWFSSRVSTFIQDRIRSLCYGLFARPLGWPVRTSVPDALTAAAPYLRTDLRGEAVLTVGGPLHDWQQGQIDAVVSVGPLECMPNKIAEAQFFHIAEREGLLSLTLSLNGDSIDPEVIDNFAFEVHARYLAKQRAQCESPAVAPPLLADTQTAAR
jgi:predicted CoA-substrate-specific enzyme activase